MSAHSTSRILFRRPVGYAANESERGRTRARSPDPRQDRRHQKFCRVMQELLSNAADRRVEGKEKGRWGAEENGR